jgi:hypothetical protein
VPTNIFTFKHLGEGGLKRFRTHPAIFAMAVAVARRQKHLAFR